MHYPTQDTQQTSYSDLDMRAQVLNEQSTIQTETTSEQSTEPPGEDYIQDSSSSAEWPSQLNLPSVVFQGPQTLDGGRQEELSDDMIAFQQARREFLQNQEEEKQADAESSFLNQSVNAVVSEALPQVSQHIATHIQNQEHSELALDERQVQALVHEIAWQIVPTLAERILRQEILKELDL